MLIRLSSVALAASLLSAAPCLALSVEDIPADTPVSALLSSAQSHLSRGETSEALMYYDAAITKNPNDYLTFFKRATTYLSLGRLNHATEDFNQVLVLKPGFEGAHLQLAKIRQRGADWDGAREQYAAAGKKADSQEVIDMDVAQNAVAAAMAAEASQNWAECDEHASTAILIANRAVSLRELRSRCRFAKGDVASAMGDLQHVLSMKPGDTSPHLRISALQFYALDDAEKGMAQARKCLHSDPDSKVCAKLLRQEKNVGKTIAKVAKSFSKKQYTTGNKHMVPSGEDKGLVQEVKEQWQKLQEDGTVPAGTSSQLVSRLVNMVCQGYFESNSKKAKEYCDEALQLDENSLYGLLYKHKTLLQDESFEAAIKILEQAGEAHPDAGETINPLMQEAQVKLKRSKTKDYYKILGVAHDADERQIKSAYRRASKQHHPDKAKAQGLSKEAAEKKMAGINEAYEVLSNPELRQRFDNGDDPMSNEQQNPFAGQNPFGGGHPFMFQQGGGGGGQQFNFKFGSGGFPGGFPFGG